MLYSLMGMWKVSRRNGSGELPLRSRCRSLFHLQPPLVSVAAKAAPEPPGVPLELVEVLPPAAVLVAAAVRIVSITAVASLRCKTFSNRREHLKTRRLNPQPLLLLRPLRPPLRSLLRRRIRAC